MKRINEPGAAAATVTISAVAAWPAVVMPRSANNYA
jgi:hypothetical protein